MANLETLRFTKTHEWLAVNGATGTVGITQHAQEEISDVVFVELPKVGAVLRAGQEAAVVESVKAAFSIYAPVAGTIASVNERLRQSPALLNSAPYDDGWIFTLKVQNASESAQLMTQHQYE
ncbi:MAG: glycine cleavage system protein H, partial [Omnitrophica WOR_2 bacterium RIFCSPHIGHO2_02_FULL_68_15]